MTRRRLRLSAGWLVIVLIPLLSTCSLSPSQTGAIYGCVRDSDTQRAMVGAIVECESTWTETDASGCYYLDGLTEGWRSVHATAGGYGAYSSAVNVSGVTQHDILMNIAVGVSHVYGVVSHPGMGPIPNASVVIGDRECFTDATGLYELWNVLRSYDRAVVSCDGFWATEVALNLEDEHHEVNVGLKKWATVSLAAIADASVRSDLPGGALGEEPTLDLFHNADYHFKFYAAFDLTMHHPVSIPEEADVEQATIELYNVWPSGESDEGVLILTGLVREVWREGTMTWSGAAPYAVGTYTDASYVPRLYSIDVTYAVVRWLSGASDNWGIVIDTPLEQQATRFSFASREHPEEGWRPKLVLHYAW